MSIEGVITITKRDAETLEVLDERVEHNIFTSYGLLGMMRALAIQADSSGSSLRDTDTVRIEENNEFNGGNLAFNLGQRGEVYLSEVACAPDVFTNWKMESIITGTTLNSPYTTFIPPSFGSPSTPSTVELAYRFAAPGSTRTVQTIGVGPGPTQGAGSNGIIAYAALSVPCIQGTSEILDVTYRMFFNNRQISDVSGKSVTFDSADQMVFGMAALNQADGWHIQEREYGWWKTPPADTFATLNQIQRSSDDYTFNNLGTARYIDQRKLRSRVTLGISTSELKGQILRSIQYGDNDSNTGVTNPYYRRSIFLSHPATDDTFANKPIQTIHNHSAGAIEPFLDVDFLATGSGKLAANGDGWIEPDFPEFYRVDIINSGDVGTSTYSFAQRKLVNGFTQDAHPNGNVQFQTMPQYLPWTQDLNGNPTYDPTLRDAKGTDDGPLRFFNDGFGSSNLSRTFTNWDHYSDDDHYILYDGNELGVINVNDGGIAYFYNTVGSPEITFNEIHQVAAEDDGTLWVATTQGGLIKIADPLGTPVVTQMTNAVNGIPSGSDNECYAVSRGNGGSIWAVFNGAIGETTNSGTSWTLYSDTTGGSPADFVWTTNGGITNGNWDEVKFMRVDQDTTDNQMCIWYRNAAATGTNRLHGVWWSTTSPATAGPAVNGAGVDNLSNAVTNGRGRNSLFRVSRTGSSWQLNAFTNSATYPALCYFGSTSITNTLPNVNSEYANPVYLYDSYGNPFWVGESTQSDYPPALFTTENEEVGRFWATDSSWGGFDMRDNGMIIALNENDGRGDCLIGGNGGFGDFEIVIGCPSPINADAPQAGGWNGADSPFEEFVWRRYNYDSTGSPIGWKQGYHFPATDTSGRNIPGVRENFDTESHRFRGRSSIDVSASTGATFAGSPITWTAVFTVSSETKAIYHDGDTKQCLIGGRDAASNTLFNFLLDDGSGNVAFDDGSTIQTFGSTPTGGSPVSTLALSVTGTTATCYLNGVQLGSPAITINPQSLEDVSGDLEVRLGSSAGLIDVGGNSVRRIRDFFIGTMRNAQLWNVAWNGTDAANHQSSPFGVIGSQPAGNLEGRWELNPTGSPAQDLTGLESKPTHASFDDLNNGITLSFGAGSPLGDFDATDFYTFGVVDGILKDNAMSYDLTTYVYHSEAIRGFSQIEDTINSPGASGSPITATIPASGGQIVEPVTWRYSTATDVANLYYYRPGQVGTANGGDAWNLNNLIGYQYIDGTGGYFEARPTFNSETDVFIGLSDSGSASNAVTDYAFRLRTDGLYEIRENNVVVGPGATAFGVGDLFRITRVAGSPNTFEYRVNNVLVYTSAFTKTPADNLSPVFSCDIAADGYGSLYDCAISWNRPAGILDLGDSVGSTGKYDPIFWGADSIGGSVLIGSPEVEMQITDDQTTRLLDLAPAPGEVIFVPDSAQLVFNAADQGSTVRANYTVIRYG